MKKFFKAIACAVSMVVALGIASAADPYANVWLQYYGNKDNQPLTIDKVTITIDGEEVDVTDHADKSEEGLKNNAYLLSGYTDENGNVLIPPVKDYIKATKATFYFTVKGATKAQLFDVVTGDDGKEGNEVWIGGAIGQNAASTSWKSAGEWASGLDGKNNKPIDLEPFFVSEDGDSCSFALSIDVAFDPEKDLVEVKGDDSADTKTEPTAEATATPAADTKTKTETKTETKTTDNATKTGDATSVAVLAVVAVLAMAGVVYTSKKKEA